jgi:hypothetical protein
MGSAPGNASFEPVGDCNGFMTETGSTFSSVARCPLMVQWEDPRTSWEEKQFGDEDCRFWREARFLQVREPAISLLNCVDHVSFGLPGLKRGDLVEELWQ